jgi:hypothetical protein
LRRHREWLLLLLLRSCLLLAFSLHGREERLLLL